MGWGAHLEGHEFDLLDWEEALRPPFDPWVQTVTRNGERLFVLRSAELDAAAAAEEVMERARVLVDRLNGAMALEGSSQPVRTGAVMQFAPDGSHLRHIYLAVGSATLRIRGSGVGVVATANGTTAPPLPAQPSPAQQWNTAAELDRSDDPAAEERAELISDLLVHLGRCDNWFDIYKTIELAEGLAGSEHALGRLAGGDRQALKNARTTANYYRHARAHRPQQPATLEEARQLAFKAARLVFAEDAAADKALG